MFFVTRFPRHMAPFQQWAANTNGDLNLDANTFRLTLFRDARAIVLYPRFLTGIDGRLMYSEKLSPDAGFVGWLPYRFKRWALASDKTLFKKTAAILKLNTPQSWQSGTPPCDNYIVKPQKGSFGRGILGPYGPLRPFPDSEKLEDNHFFEQYIVGSSAKGWFWNGIPIALEILTPPIIFGDGVRTLAQIAKQRRGNFDLSLTLEEAHSVLEWQGLTPESVAAAGQEVKLGMLHASTYDRVTLRNRDVWESCSEQIRIQFSDAARALYDAIDEKIKPNILFTIDAVVDPDERVWFLEMNSHPVVHPNAYGPMLKSLFTN